MFDTLSGMKSLSSHTVKKVVDFPVLSRDVTNQTLPGEDNLIIPSQEEFGY
jgi:hypothetical protein